MILREGGETALNVFDGFFIFYFLFMCKRREGGLCLHLLDEATWACLNWMNTHIRFQDEIKRKCRSTYRVRTQTQAGCHHV